MTVAGVVADNMAGVGVHVADSMVLVGTGAFVNDLFQTNLDKENQEV